MNQDDVKRRAGRAAMRFVENGMLVGVGTGSTVAHFIDALAERRHDIRGAVSSSDASSKLMKDRGIDVLDLNAAGPLELYVDGADECDDNKCLIKGGGAALTREKIIAAASKTFVCIIDPSKRVQYLGAFSVPVEVIPMARSHVAREIVKLDGQPVWRDGVVTDNGNWIIDIHGWLIADPVGMEEKLNQIVGVVTCGLFARRRADIVLIGEDEMR